MNLKRTLAGAAIGLLAISLSACGGDDGSDAPDNASTEEFCDVWNDEGLSIDEEASADEQADAAHDAAEQLRDIGTPEGMDEDARNGFEVFVGFLADVDANDIEAFEDVDPTDQGALSDALGINQDETADVLAFITYTATECTSGMEDLPSDLPSDRPTELPSDFPTELPSDFPTELPSDFPTELPSDFPTELLPSDFPTDFPTQ